MRAGPAGANFMMSDRGCALPPLGGSARPAAESCAAASVPIALAGGRRVSTVTRSVEATLEPRSGVAAKPLGAAMSRQSVSKRASQA